MNIKQLLLPALLVAATATEPEEISPELKSFALDQSDHLDAPLPDGLTSLEVTGDDAVYGRRRIQGSHIRDAGNILHNMIRAASKLNHKSTDCAVAQAAMLPTVQNAVENMRSWTKLVSDAAGEPESDFTIYAGVRAEYGFIRSWGIMFGVFADNKGQTGCFFTECHGWGIMAQGEYGAGGGILFGDASQMAGHSVMHPFPGGAGIGPSWGVGHGETREDGSSSAWEDQDTTDFFEWSFGFGVGAELLSWGRCTTKTEEFNFSEKVCFDIEAGDHKARKKDDEVNEQTNCEVCAAQYEKDGGMVPNSKACKLGIYNKPAQIDCIDMPSGFTTTKDVVIQTKCADALWIDRLRVGGQNGELKDYGADNNAGWCLSLDKDDYKGWNNDKIPQYVPANECFPAMRFRPGHSLPLGYYGHKMGCALKLNHKCSGSKLSGHPLTQDLCFQKCSEADGCSCVKYLNTGSKTACELWTGRVTSGGHGSYAVLDMSDYAGCKDKQRRRMEEGVEVPASLWNSTDPNYERAPPTGDEDVLAWWYSHAPNSTGL